MAKQHKKIRISATVKALIVLGALAVVFFVFALSTSIYSVQRTVKAIGAIGTVEYSEESKQKIDTANSYYNSLDANIGLPRRIDNAEELTAAKTEYVRLAIKSAYLSDKEGADEAQTTALTTQAREVFKQYFPNGESSGISNYGDLVYLEKKYNASEQDKNDNSKPSDDKKDDDIELCRAQIK